MRTGLSTLLLVLGATALPAQTRVTLPPGTVFLVRTEHALESNNAAVGQTFETTVTEDVSVNGYTVIPGSSRVRGVVTFVRPATGSQSGVMQVIFNRLSLPGGSTYAIAGKLTSTDSLERRQIDARADSRVVLVGERGGLGAAIAGAGSARGSTSSILSALGELLSEGRDVNVPAGTTFAVQLERSVTLSTRGSADLADETTIYTAPDRVRAAQRSLTQKAYYRGAATGVLDNATRRALFEFQLDNNITPTGNLDGRTAAALGVLNASSGMTRTVLSNRDASILRRAAQALESRYRQELGISLSGALNAVREVRADELDLLFAFSAFADNASLYEQFVRGSKNDEGPVLAGGALVNGARRVDAVLQQVRTSQAVVNVWNQIRAQLQTLDPAYR